jgi:tetratricopeptide (TPR) repeat protein
MNKNNSKILKLTNLAYNNLKNKNYLKSISLFKKIIAFQSNSPQILCDMATISLKLNKLKDAEKYYLLAIEKKPEFYNAICNLALIYSIKNELDLSIDYFLRATKINPKYFLAFYNLGTIYRKKGDKKKSENYLKTSIKLNPKHFPSYNNLFELYDRSNQIKELENLLEYAKSNFNQNSALIFFEGLIQYKKKNYLKAINFLSEIILKKNDVNKFIITCQIMGKCYDKIGDYEKAFYFFEKANKHNSQKLISKDEYIKEIDKKIDQFNLLKSKNLKSFNNENEFNEPIFLIGFPRSGTTLLDTILRSHPSVNVLEEKPIITKFIFELKKKLGDEYEKLEFIDESTYFSLRNIYFNERKKYLDSDKKKIVIDKLPLNIVHTQEINIFFPKAKFIFCLRNPYDVILSCFMQQFESNYAMENFKDMNSASFLYNKIMNLWELNLRNLNVNYHEIKYEDIVFDFENTIKSLLKFLGIFWTDDLIKFNETAMKRDLISTPSYDQVNQSIYIGSINRWKKYESKFEGCKKYLEKWVAKYNY